MHWMNHDAFYREVDRVLKPGGTLAVYGYGISQENKIEAHVLVSEVIFFF
jgi:predicted methyltransferase